MANFPGTSGNDSFTGGTAADSMVGMGGLDTLTGGGGDDVLVGGILDANGYANDNVVDQLRGGSGNDVYYVYGNDSVNDSVTGTAATDNADRIVLIDTSGITSAYVIATNVENFQVGVGAATEARADTVVGNLNITGNALANQIYGTGGANFINAGTGTVNDTVWGANGNDTLFGDAGNDSLLGGGDNDSVIGGTGADTLYGGAGSDTLYGGSTSGTTYTSDTTAVDRLYGGIGDDTYIMQGADSVDVILENANEGLADTIVLLSTRSAYTLAAEVENFQVGLGVASETLANSATFALNITGNTTANTIWGTGGNNSIVGGVGNDTLYGANGNDTLRGEANDDYLSGGAGTDSLIGGTGNDTYMLTGSDTLDVINELINEGTADRIALVGTTALASYDMTAKAAQVEHFQIGTGANKLGQANALTFNMNVNGNDWGNEIWGTGGNNSIVGGVGSDTLYGAGGDDTLSGGADTDVLDGGTGNDSMAGGLGNDVYYVNSQTDVVNEANDSVPGSGFVGGIDTVYTTVSLNTAALFANVENVVIDPTTGAAALDVYGNTLNNVLTGNAGNNRLTASDGNDTLIGGAGNDTLDGGVGNDSMDGGAGNDVYYVDSYADLPIDQISDSGNAIGEVDTVLSSVSMTSTGMLYNTIENAQLLEAAGAGLIRGNDYANVLTGNSFNNNMIGFGGNDTFVGGAGDDYMEGSSGADSMDGGEGADTYNVDADDFLAVDSGIAAADRDVVWAHGDYTLHASIEDLVLWTGTTGVGNGLNNKINGNGGSNSLFGGAGHDSMSGSGGGGDWLDGGEGDDSLSASGGTSDTLLVGADTLLGGAGADRLYGHVRNDILNGGTGADQMYGGTGSDTYYVDDVADIVVDSSTAAGDIDTIITSIDGMTLQTGLDNLVLLEGSGATWAIGNTTNNTLVGNTDDNWLEGGAGLDSLIGGAGADTLYGGLTDANYDWVVETEADTLVGGAGSDVYVIGSYHDKIVEEADLSFSSTDKVILADTVNGGLLSGTYDMSVEAAQVENFEVNHYYYASFSDMTAMNLNVVGNGLNNVIFGTNGTNVLSGGVGADTLLGFSGNDTLSGGDGNDSLDGGSGNDSIFGGHGDDIMYSVGTTPYVESGNSGNDTMDGGQGSDTYYVDSQGAGGDAVFDSGTTLGDVDRVVSRVSHTLDASIENLTLLTLAAVNGIGNNAANVIVGSSAANLLQGLGGDDSITGGSSGNDTLDGGTGVDTLEGGTGNDVYLVNVDGLNDKVVELAGAGTADQIILLDTAGTVYAMADEVENFQVGLGAASEAQANQSGFGLDINGNAVANAIYGTAGANQVQAGAGADTVWAADGDDYLHGEAGNDVLNGGSGNDVLIGGADADTLVGGAGDDELVGTALTGFVFVEDAATHLFQGGDGSDTYYLGNLLDQVEESATAINSNADNIVWVGGAAGAYTMADNVEGFSFWGFSGGSPTLALAVTGNAQANVIQGSAGDNVLNGGQGDDTLYGVNGNDTLNGGTGTDSLDGGAGNDTYIDDGTGDNIQDSGAAPGEIDTLLSSAAGTLLGNTLENLTLLSGASLGIGNAGNNVVTAHDGGAELIGGVGVDTLNGGAGDDVLFGGDTDWENYITDTEADTLQGGAGNDTYYVGLNDTVVETAGGGLKDTIILQDTSGAVTSLTLADNVERFKVGFDGYAGTSLMNTFLFNLNVTGNASSNFIYGTGGSNVLRGEGGDDRMYAGLGVDTLLGGAGNDTLDGSVGADVMDGGDGDDLYYQDNAADVVFDSGNPDLEDEDTLYRQITSSTDLQGTIENLWLFGSVLSGRGNTKDNQLLGNFQNNVLEGLVGTDQLNGGNGNDTLYGDALVSTGDNSADYLYGEDGDDVLNGGLGNDVLNGGAGVDTLIGGQGDDTYYLDQATDQIQEAAGEGDADTIVWAIQGQTLNLAAEVENVEIVGAASGVYVVNGNAAANRIVGSAGVDQLSGMAGNDTLSGGFGNDLYTFASGDGADVIVEERNAYDIDSAGLPVDLGGTLRFSNLSWDKLWFEQQGDDLLIEVLGSSTDNVLVNNWYGDLEYTLDNAGNITGSVLGGAYQLGTVTAQSAADTLQASHVTQLVQAMAGMTKPTNSVLNLTTTQQQTIQTIWQLV